MGNKLGRRKQAVDERYTRPQGLYVHKDVDHKKLRKLILESKLAPCYPGGEECGFDHEECPICFLYYPSLNRSRCCMKGICTECFLQMKNPNSTRPTQCPFCKTSNYAVEYRGLKTKEEKGLEQIEEQRVIEAKIRIQQQELQDEEERMQKRLELSSSSTNFSTREVECGSLTVPSYRSPVENEEINSSQYSIRHSPQPRMNRDGEFDLDLEDIMVMEAIWLSIQENGKRGNLINVAAPMPDQYSTEGRYALQTMAPLAGSSSSPSGGLACAIAALAERQQMGGESSAYANGNMSTSHTLAERQQMGGKSSAYSSGNVSTSSLHLGGSSFDNGLNGDAENYASMQSSGDMSPKRRVAVRRDDGDWTTDRVPDAAEAGSSYVGSDTTEEAGGVSALLPPPPIQDNFGDPFQNVPAPIVPESFEEQMMLAMAVSLAEARAMTAGPGSTWQ